MNHAYNLLGEEISKNSVKELFLHGYPIYAISFKLDMFQKDVRDLLDLN